MKLATLKEGGRDGSLVVVSRDLSRAVAVPAVARTLQGLIDDWRTLSPRAALVYAALNAGPVADEFAFDPERAAAPLPRAYQWIDSSAYVNHIALVRKARGVEMPPSFWTEPILYQGGSDTFLGSRDPIPLSDPAHDCDFEAEVAVIIDDVPMRADRETAAAAIRLVVLVNDVSLRGVIPAELAKGFGFFHGKPSSAFSAVAVTPDELGSHWDGTKVSLPLEVELNGRWMGSPDAGVDMTFDFPFLISTFTRTRALSAGTIVGAGTVSNVDPAAGVCCLAERRMREVIDTGRAITPFLKAGDRVRIDMRDATGQSIFGGIDQMVVAV
jgi:fumarylacetoacetate (FAA) hydrolase